MSVCVNERVNARVGALMCVRVRVRACVLLSCLDFLRMPIHLTQSTCYVTVCRRSDYVCLDGYPSVLHVQHFQSSPGNLHVLRFDATL
jgi:hypothetical protein